MTGTLTTDALKAFQRSAYDHLGKPLVVDGILGQRTAWALATVQLPSSRAAIIARAIDKLGLTEHAGTNRHPEIDEWMARCGLGPGHPWCAAFASWCLRSAGLPVAIAGALNLGRWCERTDSPVPGDVMYYPTNNTGSGHCGIVTGVTLGEVMTVEGNLRNAVRCVRRPREGLRFGRVPLPVGSALPGIPYGLSLEVLSGGARTQADTR